MSYSEESPHANEDSVYDCSEFPTDLAGWIELENANVVKIQTNNIQHVPDKIRRLRCSKLKLTRNTTHPGDGLIHLPDALACLQNLRVLSLHGNHFISYPNAHFLPQGLQELHLDHCGLLEVPRSIMLSPNIQKLVLDNNDISSIEGCPFESMFELRHLSLSGNHLTNLGYLNFRKLTTFDVSKNDLESIRPDAFEHTLSLEKLYLRLNRLKIFPSSLFKLRRLKVLDMSSNKLRRLPEEIRNLQSLSYFNISYNKLRSLPKEVGELKIRNGSFLCGENPLLRPPKPVCLKGLGDIVAYYTALDRAPGIHNRRMKILLLGESNAGKTSLAKAIKYAMPASPAVDCHTVGIDYYYWKAEPLKENGLEVLIVDCAGQRQYLMTHHFFVATDMLFVIVVDLNQYRCTEMCFKERIGDWVESIVARVPDAAITVAPTFLDEFHSDSEVLERCCHIIRMLHEAHEQRGRRISEELSRMSLQDDDHEETTFRLHHDIPERRPAFPTSIFYNGEETVIVTGNQPVIRLVPLSNGPTLEGIEEFGNEVRRIAGDERLCPNIARELPASWIKLEQYCIELQERYPDEKSMFEKGRLLQGFNDSSTCNLSMSELQSALRYLDSVGRVVDFDVAAVKDYVFLSPLWLLDLLKKLFRHDHDSSLSFRHEFGREHQCSFHDFEHAKEQLLKNARLYRHLLKCIWFTKRVSDQLLDQFVALLNKFGLLYEVEKGSSPAYIVPWFLNSGKPPAVELGWPSALEPDQVQTVTLLHVYLGPLPEGFFRRFIVSAHTLSPDCICWSTGILIMVADTGKILCTFEPAVHSSDIYIRGRCHKDKVEDLWKPVLQALMMLKDLVDEWPGLLPYHTRAVCPSCDLRLQRPSHKWPLDFKPYHRVERAKNCFIEAKSIPTAVLFPPHDVVFGMIGGINAENPRPLQNMEETLSTEEKYAIASMIGDNLRQMARALGLHDGEIEAIAADNRLHGEQVYQILQTWESRSREATRSAFVDKLKRMTPRPRDIIDFVEYG